MTISLVNSVSQTSWAPFNLSATAGDLMIVWVIGHSSVDNITNPTLTAASGGAFTASTALNQVDLGDTASESPRHKRFATRMFYRVSTGDEGNLTPALAVASTDKLVRGYTFHTTVGTWVVGDQGGAGANTQNQNFQHSDTFTGVPVGAYSDAMAQNWTAGAEGDYLIFGWGADYDFLNSTVTSATWSGTGWTNVPLTAPSNVDDPHTSLLGGQPLPDLKWWMYCSVAKGHFTAGTHAATFTVVGDTGAVIPGDHDFGTALGQDLAVIFSAAGIEVINPDNQEAAIAFGVKGKKVKIEELPYHISSGMLRPPGVRK